MKVARRINLRERNDGTWAIELSIPKLTDKLKRAIGLTNIPQNLNRAEAEAIANAITGCKIIVKDRGRSCVRNSVKRFSPAQVESMDTIAKMIADKAEAMLARRLEARIAPLESQSQQPAFELVDNETEKEKQL